MLRSKSPAAADNGGRPFAAESATTTVHLLHRAGQCADEFFAAKLPLESMTPRQYAVLKAVAAIDEPSQNAIVAATGIDRSTIADIVRRLVQRGWLQRRRTRHDARMYALKLAAKGQAALRSAEPHAVATDALLLSPLTATEREVFVKSLERIISAAGASKLNGSQLET